MPLQRLFDEMPYVLVYGMDLTSNASYREFRLHSLVAMHEFGSVYSMVRSRIIGLHHRLELVVFRRQLKGSCPPVD